MEHEVVKYNIIYLFFSDTNNSNQINRIITHPTRPVTITAHEDRHIRFFDNNTGNVHWKI